MAIIKAMGNLKIDYEEAARGVGVDDNRDVFRERLQRVREYLNLCSLKNVHMRL